jgi:ubiquinone/menaquinone biosynthesis C-methylase UbiE
MPDLTLADLPPWAFEKQDPDDDAAFYGEARLVTHIDEGAIAALTEFYRIALPAGAVVLDLMSSCVSHLPGDVPYAEVIGHGMNAEELSANPQLTRWFVHDLNREPVLPLAHASVDAVTICVGVQYLQQPVAVLAEVRRVLKPNGLVAISFSNRCFPTKAMAIWLNTGDEDHANLVGLYLTAAGFTAIEARRLADGSYCDPLFVVTGRNPPP